MNSSELKVLVDVGVGRKVEEYLQNQGNDTKAVRDMVLTIEITPELESQVREQAEQRGLGAGEYVVNILREHLRQTPRIDARCLPEAQARLLQQINEGLYPEMWRRYISG